MNINWKDVAVRAIKTFAEAAVATFLAGVNGVDLFTTEHGFWVALAISAGAAGVSAVWNGLIEPAVKPLLGGNKEA